MAAGLPARWAAFDEVYGRSGKLRQACEDAGLAYVAIIPCDFPVTTAAGAVIRADEAARDAVFERRSCGTGTKGPRISDWALIAHWLAAGVPAHPPPALPPGPDDLLPVLGA